MIGVDPYAQMIRKRERDEAEREARLAQERAFAAQRAYTQAEMWYHRTQAGRLS